MSEKSGQLAVVSTPIGNLGDFSPRAAETLQNADILACEDTRMTRKLLALCGCNTKAKFMPYHDHNGHLMRPKLLKEIADGKNVALVSDAGTPLISDPGYKLVAEAHEYGFKVTSIPGPSAVLASLASSGLPSDRFLFAGFVPNSIVSAKKLFGLFKDLPVTTIWFDSPKRLAKNLTLMAETFGPRLAVVARELTKLHEDYRRANLVDLADLFTHTDPPRGEIVVLIEGASKTETKFDDMVLKQMLKEEMHNTSMRDAVKVVANISGVSRQKIYRIAIDLL